VDQAPRRGRRPLTLSVSGIDIANGVAAVSFEAAARPFVGQRYRRSDCGRGLRPPRSGAVAERADGRLSHR